MPRLSPAAPSKVSRSTAKALSCSWRSRRCASAISNCPEAQAEAQVLGVAEAGLHRPPLLGELDDLLRGRGTAAGYHATGLLHALCVHAHGRTVRAVHLFDRSIAQLARQAALFDSLLCRAHRPVDRADPGVALQMEHVILCPARRGTRTAWCRRNRGRPVWWRGFWSGLHLFYPV